MSKLPHCKVTCAECPWLVDAPLGHFPPERFVALAGTASDMSRTIFTCHMSKEDTPVACAGFLLKGSRHNLSVRLDLSFGRLDMAKVSASGELYPNYRAMALANGVEPDHPDLGRCRDD